MRRLKFAAGLVLLAGTASATPVVYDFSGTITNGAFGGAFGLPLPYVTDSVGKLATGSVTIDPTAPDQDPNPTSGFYAALLSFEVHFNGMSFLYDASTAPAGSIGAVQVDDFDGVRFGGDSYNLVSVTTDGATSDALAGIGTGNERAAISLAYLSEDLGVIASDAMPASLDVFNDLGFFIQIYDPTAAFVSPNMLTAGVHLTRRPDTVSVPEPAPLPLLAFGLTAAIAGRWITRRAARVEVAGSGAAA